MQKLPHQTHSFDQFTLDLTRGCLLRGQEDIKLRPKAFEVLSYLVQNHGRLVRKDELIQAVWVDTAVTDDSLVQCLMEVRRALGDEAQQIIKTVPRRGYIFDREVRENGSPAQVTTYTEETAGVQVIIEEERSNGSEVAVTLPEPDSHSVGLILPQDATRVRRLTRAIKRHKVTAAVVVVSFSALVIAGVAFARPFLFWWFKPPSIAVLPMVNATGDPKNDYLSDGLTESLITSLNQMNTPGVIPRLLVTAESTVFAFKGREPLGVGRELGVDTVLASKVMQENGRWIIKTEMINVANGSQLSSGQYTASTDFYTLEGILQIQDQIPIDVAGKLPLRLSSDEKQRLTIRYTQNGAAYDAFLKGRSAWRKATPEYYKKSLEYYQQAIDLDPNFALPYWGMGASCVLMGITGVRQPKEAFEKGTEWYLKALNIDNTLNAAKHDLELQDMNAWAWAKIEKAGPNHAGYAFPHGGYLIAMGRLDEQLAFENDILSWEPHNPPMIFFHGDTLFLARQYDAAIEQYHKSIKLGGDGPAASWVHLGLGQAYMQKAMFTEAIAEFSKAKDLLKDAPPAWEALGYAYAMSGQRDEALKILNQLQERANQGEYVMPMGIAWIYIGLGAKDQAFVWIDKAFAEQSSLLRIIKTDPIYDPLRSDPRFTELLRRMKLPT